jgi:hypothetical protein
MRWFPFLPVLPGRLSFLVGTSCGLLLVAGGPPVVTDPGAVGLGAARPAVARPAVARPAARRAAAADQRLIVSMQPPPPAPKKKAKAPAAKGGKARRVLPYRRYGGYSRRATTLYLRDRPDGAAIVQLRIGLHMTILERRGRWSRVETAGLIRVRGWVPSVTLGLRVQRTAKLYGRPGGKPLGKVAGGHLVHVARLRAGWARVRLMGYTPLECWMKRADLGIATASYSRLKGRYPGGSAMVVSPGAVHASANGPAVAKVSDEGRVYRVRVTGRWSRIAVYNYSRVQLEGWVPTFRLRWGSYPWYGSGYSNYHCQVGRSGSRVALAEFKVYAARDDAWPTIRILPNARFNVSPDRPGWVRITSYSCISFVAYAQDRPGDWSPAYR